MWCKVIFQLDGVEKRNKILLANTLLEFCVILMGMLLVNKLQENLEVETQGLFIRMFTGI